MKYYEVRFKIVAPEELREAACDLVTALAGEAGFETFETTDEGVVGYVQQSLFDKALVEAQLDDLPLPNCSVTFTVAEAADEDWNAQWEQEGFEPIVIPFPAPHGGELIIHDGRHLPPTPDMLLARSEACPTTDMLLARSEACPTTDKLLARSEACPTTDPSTDAVLIEIDARLAFGTGTHQTTRLMVQALMKQQWHREGSASGQQGLRVLDCGTGTGILSIAALKMGAVEAVGYDIDEWSADNARHNAIINCVDDRFTSLLGDASVLNSVEGTFDVVVANINRNILLADMPAFVSKLTPGGSLILSGFYATDIPLLVDKAQSLGLTLNDQHQNGEWACLIFA